MLALTLYIVSLFSTQALSQICAPELGVETVQLSNAPEIWPDLEHCALISRAHMDSLEDAQLYALGESKPSSEAHLNLPLRSFAQLNDAPAEAKTWQVLVASGYDDFAQQALCRQLVREPRVRILRGGFNVEREIALNRALPYLGQHALIVGTPGDQALQSLATPEREVRLLASLAELDPSESRNVFVIGDVATGSSPAHWFRLQVSSTEFAFALQQHTQIAAASATPLHRPCYLP